MKAVIALGANLDDPRGSVELALTLLEQSTDLLARSSLYLTKPVGGPPQGDFINAVCIVETELPPQELLNLLHGIEKSMGRVRGEKWGPRVIDLDLITYGDERFVSDELVLPHPLAHERQFVLEPWLEIDPDAQIPGHGRVEDILRREANEEIAFVPTMGALHAGHASLIEAAKSLSDYVLVSVFVNPLQFEDAKDLENYPRSPDTDREIAKNAGASAVWFPSVQEIFGEDLEPISAGKIGDLYEGAARAGHFSGMLTAVNQLFQLVKPTYAIFGEKDFQQLFLIKNMVKESGLPIKIIGAPTIRESDGLAMSSRNIRLNSVGRDAALVISRALFAAAKESSLSDQKRLLVQILDSEPNFRLDYAVIIDEETFSPAVEETIHKRALVAGWVNGVRLIDNISMGKFNG